MMRRLTSPLLVLVALAGTAFAQQPHPVPIVDVPLVVDGVLDSIMGEAPMLTTVTPLSHEPTPTRGWILATDTHLHVFIEGDDRDLRATRTQRDSDVFRDDVFEVFIEPERGAPHFHFEVNPLGTVHDGHLSGPPQVFNPEGLGIATAVNGTLNDASDEDEGWALEIAIPFGAVGHPEPGDVWRFHLARYDWSIHAPDGEKQLSSTSPLTRVNFHRPEEWGEMVFVQP